MGKVFKGILIKKYFYLRVSLLLGRHQHPCITHEQQLESFGVDHSGYWRGFRLDFSFYGPAIYNKHDNTENIPTIYELNKEKVLKWFFLIRIYIFPALRGLNGRAYKKQSFYKFFGRNCTLSELQTQNLHVVDNKHGALRITNTKHTPI